MMNSDFQVPFFNLVGFVLGTYINTQTKRRRRLAALKKQVTSFNFSESSNSSVSRQKRRRGFKDGKREPAGK